jgi:hypothetical protein
MNPEKYVVGLEPAKKLKERGYPQENSLFGYYDPSDYENRNQSLIVLSCQYAEWLGKYGKASYEFKYAASISDEILEKLPKEIMLGKEKYEDFATVTVYLFEEGNHIFYDGDKGEYFECRQDRFVDSVAELWLKLKEGGYL